VYPNGYDLTDDIPIGKFESLEQCRDAAHAALERHQRRDENGDRIPGDYECGLNCRPTSGGLNVCERTEE